MTTGTIAALTISSAHPVLFDEVAIKQFLVGLAAYLLVVGVGLVVIARVMR